MKPYTVIVRHPDGRTEHRGYTTKGAAHNAALRLRRDLECPVYVYPTEQAERLGLIPKDPTQ